MTTSANSQDIKKLVEREIILHSVADDVISFLKFSYDNVETLKYPNAHEIFYWDGDRSQIGNKNYLTLFINNENRLGLRFMGQLKNCRDRFFDDRDTLAVACYNTIQEASELHAENCGSD